MSKVSGPQLTFDKTYLFMNAELDQIKQDIIVIHNVGSSTVTYEWKQVQRGDHVRSKKSDFAQRFFCHYPRSMVKPGESKAFTFSFKSDKVGMFNEEWELLTEPKLIQPLSLISLNGIATQEDQLAAQRDGFWKGFNQDYPAEEQPSQDMLEGFVRNQPVDKPNLEDPYVLCQVFEKCNRHLGLYYTKAILETFFEIFDDVCFVLKSENPETQVPTEWDTCVESLQALIQKVHNKYTHQDIYDRFVKTLSQAKKTPNDRALSHRVFQKSIASFIGEVVDCDVKTRTAIDLPLLESWQFVPEDWTEEQIKAHQ